MQDFIRNWYKSANSAMHNKRGIKFLTNQLRGFASHNQIIAKMTWPRSQSRHSNSENILPANETTSTVF